MIVPPLRVRARDIGEGEHEEQIGEDKIMQESFVNICQPGTMWHATSASEARVARLGSRMDHLTTFRDSMHNLRV